MSRLQGFRAVSAMIFMASSYLLTGAAVADQAPIAVNDRVVVRGMAFVLIDALANDSDGDGDPLTATATGGVAVTNLGDGLFQFQPGACLWEPQSFTYQVDDGDADTPVATATVHLIPGGCGDNFNVLAMPDTAWTPPNTPVMVDVLENDSDPDGDPLCIVQVDSAVHGTAQIAADCLTVTFSPDPGYQGAGASFRYRVQDGRGGDAQALVSVTVDTDPDHPDLPGDQFTTEKEKILALPAAVLLGNDGAGLSFVDAFSDSGDTIDVIWPPGGGALVLYHPPPGFVGTRHFTYAAVDSSGLEHYGAVTVRITTPVGTMRALDDFLDARIDGCLVVDFESLIANDQGGGLGVEAYDLFAQPLAGTLATIPTGTGLVVSYDAPRGYAGKDFFTYVVEDELSNADVATVVIDVQSGASAPHQPVATADFFSVTGNTNPAFLTLPVLDNDYDPDCDALTVSVVTQPSLGTVSVLGDGSLRYAPYPDATGADAFTYRVQDSDGETDTGMVTIRLVDQVAPPWPRFWYRSCENLATCIVDGRDSRRGDGTFFPFGPHLCNLAWTFEGATPPPGDSPSCLGGVPAPLQSLDDYYTEPGLRWVELTLWHFDHRVTAGRWVPVGGTLQLPTPPFDTACDLSTCTFTPQGNYLDGTIDRFEWFVDAPIPSGDPDYITTTAEPLIHTFPGASPGDRYRVWLVFYPFEGRPSVRSMDLTLPGPPPAAPLNLTLVPSPFCHVSGPQLEWHDASDNEDGFRVYRSVNGGLFKLQAVLAAGTTAFLDTYVGPPTDELTYRVASFNAFGESAAGPLSGFRSAVLCEAPAEALPLVPQELATSGPAAGGVTLTWIDPSTNESGFRIYRQEPGQPAVWVGSVGADVTTYFDGGLVPGTEYSYRVAAFNGNGEGELSAPAPFTLSDGVFGDGFETSGVAGWSSTAGSALTVSTEAAIFGTFGLAVNVEATSPSAVVDDSPASDPRYRARFYLDPSALDTSGLGIGAGEVLTLLDARTEGGGLPVFALRLFPSLGGQTEIEGLAFGDGGAAFATPRRALPRRSTAIEVEWWQDASAGGLRLWLDGDQAGQTPVVANGTLAVGEVHLGALGVADGAGGKLAIDEFASRRASSPGHEDLAGEVLVDEFEDGGLLLWETVTGGGGSISASPAAALSGELGALVSLGAGQVAYLEQDLATSESHILARFLVDTGGLSLGPGNEVRLLTGIASGAADPAFRLKLRKQGAALNLIASATLDSGDRSETAALAVPTTGLALVEVEWHAARPGKGNGLIRLKVGDPATGSDLKSEALELGNETQRVELLRLGPDVPAGLTTQGTVALDRIEMWR